MFEALKSYKSIYNRDVAFYVHFSQKLDDGWSLRGVWMNIVNAKNIFKVNRIDTIFISNKRTNDWEEFKTTNS